MHASTLYRIAAVLLPLFAAGHTLGFRQSDPTWGVDFGADARYCVGVRPLLCRHHGCELEIPLYPTHRFLNRDYIMFDCGGMAFGEAKLKADSCLCSSCEFDGRNEKWHMQSPQLRHLRSYARRIDGRTAEGGRR